MLATKVPGLIGPAPQRHLPQGFRVRPWLDSGRLSPLRFRDFDTGHREGGERRFEPPRHLCVAEFGASLLPGQPGCLLDESSRRPVLAQPCGEHRRVKLALFASASRRRVDDGPIAGPAIERKRAAADAKYTRVIGRDFCFRPYVRRRNSVPLTVSDRGYPCGDGGNDGLVINALAERGEPPNQLLPESSAIGRARLDWDCAEAGDMRRVSTSDSCNQGSAWRKRTNMGRIVWLSLLPARSTMRIANKQKLQEGVQAERRARTRAKKHNLPFFVHSWRFRQPFETRNESQGGWNDPLVIRICLIASARSLTGLGVSRFTCLNPPVFEKADVKGLFAKFVSRRHCDTNLQH